MLPWVDLLLDRVKNEYNEPYPNYTLVDATVNDMDYIKSIVKNSDFDELNLKTDLMNDYTNGKASIWKSTCNHGEIIYIGDDEKVPLHVWWRCIRLLSKSPVRIVIFGSNNLRKMPEHGVAVRPAHINGGYANRCDSRSIVIYRKEEATRVLIHELLHASCSDPKTENTSRLESDTEAWAEIIQCAMIVKGAKTAWTACMKEQIAYSLRQAATLRDNHKVHSEKDYAWRYTLGRLDVWRNLGLDVSEPPKSYKALTSLRLTLKEPLS
jgi:hypothetical protein